MKLLILILTLLTALVVPTSARLGETVAECDKRYGEPIETTVELMKPASEVRLYEKAGFMVIVQFWKGRAAVLMFAKTGDDGPREISETERSVIFTGNSGGLEWKKRQVIAIDPEWELDTDKGIATYSVSEKNLMLMTGAFYEAVVAAKAKAEEKALEDF